jgi:hypothetical protein
MNTEHRFDAVHSVDQIRTCEAVFIGHGEYSSREECERQKQDALSSTEKRRIRLDSYKHLRAGTALSTAHDRFLQQMNLIFRARRKSFLVRAENCNALMASVRKEFEIEHEIAEKFERRRRAASP